MPDNHHTSESLLSKAVQMLNEGYDSDHDSFFVVVTKDGKDPNLVVGDQAIIGELNLKTVVAFMVQVIQQLCEALGIHPFTFIVRHLLGYFLELERQEFTAMMSASEGRPAAIRSLLDALFDPDSDGYYEEVEEDGDEEDGDEEKEPEKMNYYIVNPALTDTEN